MHSRLRACVTSTRPRWRERPSSDSLRRVNGSERLRSALDAFHSPSPLALADESAETSRARSVVPGVAQATKGSLCSCQPTLEHSYRVLPILIALGDEPRVGRSLERDAVASPLAGEARLRTRAWVKRPLEVIFVPCGTRAIPLALRSGTSSSTRNLREPGSPRVHSPTKTLSSAKIRAPSAFAVDRETSRSSPRGHATILANADMEHLCYRDARPP